ncbi:MAG: MaoC family dehydratase [Betaproteobacteria bacterium]|nr:MaoC family dehydratase [Betaproteobacteria bacterium]NBY05846.1 MaoC family dehydratase [Betaproteobacteria bacterium]
MSHQCTFNNLDELRQAVGREAFVTDWVLIDQKRIDLFALATDDPQWIHVDPVRSAQESPFGCTIAHGFLTLSLLGRFYDHHMALPFCKMGINYGLNRVRFTNPVKVDRRVRGRFVLAQLEDIAGGVQMTFNVTIEIDGEERPACVAESVVRQYFEAAI